MIPERIQLAGFLCYREPREACFRGRTLWMLTGPNGSGKSALFDAVTYALFGQHRGGKQNARGLIHHGCDRLAVEFDFRLDEQLVRARRTLSRQGRATRQILAWSNDSSGEVGQWVPVRETHTERGFAQWIEAHIALTYDTFTASVLLLQGRAENLLLATPAQRLHLLSQVVGLDRFQQLAERAGRRLAQAEGVAQACRHQIRQLDPVDETELHRLRRRIAAVERQVGQQLPLVEQLTNTSSHAIRYDELNREIDELQAETTELANRLENLERSEAEERRQAELSAQLAALNQLRSSRSHVDRCRANRRRLETQQRAAQSDLGQCEAVLRDTEQSIATIRQKLTEITTKEKKISGQHVARQWACSAARRFAQARDDLQRSRSAQSRLKMKLQDVQHECAALQETILSEQEILSAQKDARTSAADVARHEARVTQMRQQLERFESVAGQRCCPYCRQPLDQTRYAHERERLDAELQEAETDLETARSTCVAAERREVTMRTENERKRGKWDTAQQKTRDLQAELQGMQLVEHELVQQLQRTHEELPSELQAKVPGESPAAWSTAAFPDAKELQSMQQDLDNADDELKQLAATNRALQDELERRVQQQQQATARRHSLARALETCNERVAQERGELTGYLTLYASAQAAVPRQWQDLALSELSNVIQSLDAQCRGSLPATPDQEQNRERDELDSTAQRLRHLNAKRDVLIEQRERIPADARHGPDDIRLQLQQARQSLRQAEAERSQLRSELSAAEQRSKTCQQAEEKWRSRRRECRLWKRVTQLLGREGLQRALLDYAEQAIVQYANTILDRITGGQLYVELAQLRGGSRSKKVLELVAHPPGADSPPQDVAFLSGSQKFRVAVALSLAIGQFSSTARRPVQAVIIDEGFGCLDSMNRHVMIQELQNLRDHLQRILLVSHQDEFANAFPDGYRCELVDGATQLTPFQAGVEK